MSKFRTLVVAPHPDDETLGCGGTIAKLSDEGAEVHVLIVTKGDELFDQDRVEKGREEAVSAGRHLGVKKVHFADLPSIKLDTLPQYTINNKIGEFLGSIQPQTMYVPFYGDVNSDHRIVCHSAAVAARPGKSSVLEIYCYETLSSTNWGLPGILDTFKPNVYMDITGFIEKKIQAFRIYETQIKDYPHARSPEQIRNLASLRGSSAGLEFSEAFMCMKKIIAV